MYARCMQRNPNTRPNSSIWTDMPDPRKVDMQASRHVPLTSYYKRVNIFMEMTYAYTWHVWRASPISKILRLTRLFACIIPPTKNSEEKLNVTLFITRDFSKDYPGGEPICLKESGVFQKLFAE